MQQGYKQTEIGVIPEEWKIASLKDLSDGQFTYGVNAPAIPYAPPLPNYIRITDISDDGRFIRESRTSVDCQNPEMYTLKENDIVFARTGASTGKTYLYRKSDGALVYAGFLIKASILPEKANSKYVFDNLHTNRYWDWVSVTSMRSGQPGINGNEYASYMIPCPSLLEQEHIAEALSDVDGMISSLKKLIAKKKAVKQGAMQELLTGKKRLPGFSRKWGKFKLGDLCCISGRIGFRGYTKDDLVNKGFGAITFSPSDIFEQKLDYSNCDYISFFKYDESPEIQVFNGDIIFCKTASIGKTALVKNLTEKATINPQFVLMNKFKCNNEFLYYIISGKEFVEQILSITGGSTIPTISQEQLKMQLIYMPELDEQNAIASILSDMDNEIEALEHKLEKTRQIKQGMMQQLLTGKIRLV